MKTPRKIATKYPLLVQMARAAFGLLPGCGVINFGIFAVQAGQRLWGWMQARTPQERVLVLQDATQAATGDMHAAIAEAKKQLEVELKDVSPETIANVTNWLQSAPGHLNRTFGGTFAAMQTHGGSQLAALNSANRLHVKVSVNTQKKFGILISTIFKDGVDRLFYQTLEMFVSKVF